MCENSNAWLKSVPFLDSETGQKVARQICEECDFSLDDFFALVKAKIKEPQTQRRRELFSNFDDIFEQKDDDVD